MSVIPSPVLNGVVPPGPVHEPVYVVGCEGDTVVEPEGPTAPMLEMVQPVALVEDQESVAVCPCAMEPGLTEIVAVGGTGTVTVTVPYVVHELKKLVSARA